MHRRASRYRVAVPMAMRAASRNPDSRVPRDLRAPQRAGGGDGRRGSSDGGVRSYSCGPPSPTRDARRGDGGSYSHGTHTCSPFPLPARLTCLVGLSAIVQGVACGSLRLPRLDYAWTLVTHSTRPLADPAAARSQPGRPDMDPYCWVGRSCDRANHVRWLVRGGAGGGARGGGLVAARSERLLSPGSLSTATTVLRDCSAVERSTGRPPDRAGPAPGLRAAGDGKQTEPRLKTTSKSPQRAITQHTIPRQRGPCRAGRNGKRNSHTPSERSMRHV